jgi:hypothetical protein
MFPEAGVTVSDGRGPQQTLGDAIEACDPTQDKARFDKLNALKRDVLAGLMSIEAGRVSRATPKDIKSEALRRRAMR